MATYYVLHRIDDYEPGISKFATLDEALVYYNEVLTVYCTQPILTQEIDVTLTVTDLDGNQAIVALGKAA